MRDSWIILLMGLALVSESRLKAASSVIDFSRDIRPILSDNCFACHGPDKDKRKAGFRLDLKDEAFKKLESGDFAVVAGKPAQSKLLKAVMLADQGEDHMPPKKAGKKLTPAQIGLLRSWIEHGA